MAANFELKFSADLRDALAQVGGLTAGLGATAKGAADLGQQLGLTTTSVNAAAAATAGASAATQGLRRDVAETSAAFGQAEPAVSAFGTAVQKIGGFFAGLGAAVQQGLAPVNAAIPGFASGIAEAAVEVASFATGTGLVVTPLLVLGNQLGSAGTLAAAAGAAFFIFSSRMAGARLAVTAFSEALGLTALRTMLIGVAVEFAPFIAVLAGLYAAVQLWSAGMAAADARLANLKSLEKLSHDANQAAAALKTIQGAASDTGVSDTALTKAYVALAGLKDQALLTGESLRAVAGIAVTAGRPVETLASQIAAVYRGIRQGGDDGQKATRAAIKALQDEGVFADRARDRVDALQRAHADEGRILAVVRGEIAQYAGTAEQALGTVGGEWARLKQQAASALGEMFSPLAELRNVLGGYLATAIRAVADGLNNLRGVIRNDLTADVAAFVGTIDEVRVAADTIERWTGRLRDLCDQLQARIEGGIKVAFESVRATLEDWGAAFTRVFDAAMAKVSQLIDRLGAVGTAIRRALAGVASVGQQAVGAVSSAASSAYQAVTGGGGSGTLTLGGGEALPSWMTELATGFKQDYADAQASLAAGKAKAAADADKAKADAFARDEARAVSPKTYDDEDGGKAKKGGGGATARKAEVDQGAEAEKHYRQELDLTKSALALGEISVGQAQAQNAATVSTYIARLRQLQAALPATSDKYRELTVRIKDAQQLLAQQSVFGNVRLQLTGLANEWGNAAQQVGNFAKQTAQTISTTIGSALTDVIFRTGNWRQTMAQAAKSIIGSLIQIGVQMVISNVLGNTLSKSTAATQAADSAAIASAAAPAAAATSISSYGAAAAVGGAAAAAAIALIIGLISGGFREGGYTGHGAPDEPAGVVHRGEYVHSAPVVNRLGVPFLQSLASGGFPMTRPLAGYQGGGLVTGSGAGYSPTGLAGGPGGAGGGNQPVVVNVHSHPNEEAMLRAMRSTKGRNIWVDHATGKAVDFGLNT